ncbi:putative MFS family arabinose efflux permease [Paenibacillus sp. W2I17]|nr:putative MFS family arabinose efflux permease [Paenibacillus sp. W2I17]
MAAGAGIGGIAVNHNLLNYIPWIGALALVISIVTTLLDNSLSKKKQSKRGVC